jgi:hypothetical protein
VACVPRASPRFLCYSIRAVFLDRFKAVAMINRFRFPVNLTDFVDRLAAGDPGWWG